jgi:hypothetical protein
VTVWHLDSCPKTRRWCNRRGENWRLPCTAWTRLEVWYRIRQGIRGLLAHDERGRPRVYVVCEPSSHYYQIMTRGSRWMPALIKERI